MPEPAPEPAAEPAVEPTLEPAPEPAPEPAADGGLPAETPDAGDLPPPLSDGDATEIAAEAAVADAGAADLGADLSGRLPITAASDSAGCNCALGDRGSSPAAGALGPLLLAVARRRRRPPMQ
jgi:MYXO-CTERM domain-containing protein